MAHQVVRGSADHGSERLIRQDDAFLGVDAQHVAERAALLLQRQIEGGALECPAAVQAVVGAGSQARKQLELVEPAGKLVQGVVSRQGEVRFLLQDAMILVVPGHVFAAAFRPRTV